MDSDQRRQAIEAVDAAIASRRSIRRFLPTPVPEQVVRDILAVASRAPSGTNMQPWQVRVVAGPVKEALCRALLAAHDAGKGGGLYAGRKLEDEHRYYPHPLPEPYLSRRRKLGWDLYGSLGIRKGEHERMHAQTGRNYLFFDAPVGMIFTIDRVLEIGSWLDYGTFLQNIAVAARARGLDTCMQAAFARMHTVLRAELGIPESQVVVCGLSLGHADTEAPENRFAVERLAVDEFARFTGF
jgi:nitroreductase